MNQILDQEDKQGGRAIIPSQTRAMWKAVDSGELIDMGFSRPRYTWSNNRGGGAKIKERLDRAFCNFAWRNRFSTHIVRHLARSCFDHFPIYIAVAMVAGDLKKGGGFKMQEIWLRNPTFESLVASVWGQTNGDLEMKIKTLQWRLQTGIKPCLAIYFTKKLVAEQDWKGFKE